MDPTRKMPVKRRLPAWMETVHKQNSKSKSTSESQVSDIGVPEKIEMNKNKKIFQLNSGTQKVVNENIAPEKDSSKISQETLFEGKHVEASQLAPGQVIEQSMPFLEFPGRVTYSCHDADCAGICSDILSSLNSSGPIAVGFDMEWPVTFHKNSSPKTALIQLCLSENECYLFHISSMLKFPTILKNLICDSRLVLVGLNIEADLWRLERDYDFRVKPLIDRGSVSDVGKLANQKLKSTEKWTLDGLCKNVLRERLNKDVTLRCGDWSKVPLSEKQKLYAATDAYAGLLLYRRLLEKCQK